MKKESGKALLFGSLLTCLLPTQVKAGQLEVETSDVITVVTNCIPYIIGFAMVIIIVIIISILAKKQEISKRKMIRGQAAVVSILSLGIAGNLLCAGPLKSLLDVVANPVKQVSDETREEANQLIADIAGEGMVLVKNDGTLPLASDIKKLNVFGWASTQPCYGGTGSGAVDTANCVTLLQGIEAGGYELNDRLEELYTSYATARGGATMSSVDWTLPEPTVD